MSTGRNIGIAAGIGTLIALAFVAKGQSKSSGSDTAGSDPLPDPSKPVVPKKVSPGQTPTATPVWETWAKELGGPAQWYQSCYNSGIRNKNVAHILVVLRSKKDLGYKPGVLNWKYDDVARASYVKWAVRRAAEIGVDFNTIPLLYLKAFNQDVKIQYSPVWTPNSYVKKPLDQYGLAGYVSQLF